MLEPLCVLKRAMAVLLKVILHMPSVVVNVYIRTISFKSRLINDYQELSLFTVVFMNDRESSLILMEIAYIRNADSLQY